MHFHAKLSNNISMIVVDGAEDWTRHQFQHMLLKLLIFFFQEMPL